MAAQINIKVNSDFAKASADLKKFGTVTEQEAKRVQRFQESFKTEQIDSFIDRTRRTGAAMKGMGGEMTSLTAQQKALQRQAESLVKKGLDPQDASVQKLVAEYDRLEKELQDNIRAQKGMETATKIATTSLLAIGAAAVGVGIAAAKSTVELAKMGDTIAKTSARTGIGVEALQEYSFAAERSGLSANALGGIFQKLNKSVGDVQANTGALTTLLKESNPVLLEQLRTIDDTDEAFNLLLSEIEKAPTQFEKAALAQAAFGRSGQDLINFADQGSEEIARLREEAQAYGVISEETAKKSEDFVDAQRNLKQAFTGLRSEFANKLLPTFSSIINSFARFIADTEKVKRTLNTLIPILAGVTAGLTTFLIITKGATALQALVTVFRTMNAVIAANPIGFLATVIVAVLIPAIIFLAQNWDAVVVLIQTTTEILKEKLATFIVATKSKWISQLNQIKIVFLELAQVIIDKLLGAVQSFLDLAGKMPFVGDKFLELSDSVGTVRESLNENIDAAQAASQAAIDGADAAILAREAERDANIAIAREERAVRLAELKAASEDADLFSTEQIANLEEHEAQVTEIMTASLQERLAILNNVEAMALAEREITFETFLNARAEQEGVAGEARIAFLQKELERIQSLESISNEERVTAAATVQQMITDEERRATETRIALKRKEASAVASLFGSLSSLITAFAGENREAAIAAKGLAMAQAGINSALAFTQVIADPTLPFFLKGISAASILASGIAQQVNIASTPIPSAQTGTGEAGFVPTSRSSMADTSQVNVSEGEQIIPRGESRDLTIITQINDEVLWSSVQRGIDANEITVTDDNIRAVG